MRAKNTTAGFTLPEVLTSVLIVGMMLALLYSVWSATLTVTATGTVAAEDVQRERMAMKAISEALAGASWYEHRAEEPLRLDRAEGFSQLKIISRVPPGFWGERELGDHPLRRIEFRAEPKHPRGFQLVMLQQTLLSSTNSTEFHRTVLLPHLETFSVEVQPADPKISWEQTWPSAGTNSLPRLARVTLAAGEKHPRRRVLPIFANAAAHAQGVPVIGRVVRISEVEFGEGGFEVPEESDATGRLIFIIDKSLSMRGIRLQMAKDALMKSLNQLEEGQKFYIYFFNGKSDALPSAMLDATPDNIQRVTDWIAEQKVGWDDKGIMEAIKGAFGHEPTEVFLLTDGAGYAPDFRQLIGSLNPDQSVKVNTHGIGERITGREDETVLMLIAKENGGTYTSILPIPDGGFSPPPGPKKK